MKNLIIVIRCKNKGHWMVSVFFLSRPDYHNSDENDS